MKSSEGYLLERRKAVLNDDKDKINVRFIYENPASHINVYSVFNFSNGSTYY